MLTIDSVVETGKVEVFVPQDRNQPASIVSDTRGQSVFRPFDQLFAEGHFAEAAIVAERELQAARESDRMRTQTSSETSSPHPAPGQSKTLVSKLLNVAIANQRSGRFDQAQVAADEAVAICEAFPDEFAETLIRLLHLRLCLRFFNQAVDESSTQDPRREMESLRRRSEQILGNDHPQTARIMVSQARLLMSEFSYYDAEDLLKEAIQIQLNAPSTGGLDRSESMLELARVSAYLEKHELADEGFQNVLALRESICGPDHPDVADVLFHYTDFLIYNRGDGARAGSLLRRAMKIWSETIGLDHSTVVKESGFIRKVLAVDAEPSE